MSKFFMLLTGMIILYNFSYTQTSYILRGIVIDENNDPLPGAYVYLNNPKRGVTSNSKGYYQIENLAKGSYELEVSFIGYKTFKDTVFVENDKNYDIKLSVSILNLQEVVITDNYAETRKKAQSLNIEIVNEDFLKQNLGGSLMKSLERLPGVSTIDIGSGQSKPVIRGMGFNRVIVVENNIKHEAQQWGADHGLEIDQYAIDNIEVIKGPASLMYGSDAIGGVIDMKSRRLPSVNTFGGTINLTGKSNNNLLGTSISLHARKNLFFVDFRATILDYGDYKVPVDSIDIYSYRAALYKNYLRNTAGKENDFHLHFGLIHKRFQSKFFVSSVNSKNGFFANAHGLEPRNVDTDLHDNSSRDIQFPNQSVNHFKIVNNSHYKFNNIKIDLDLGYQKNFRQERSQYVSHGYMPAVYNDSFAFDSDLERQFEKHVYVANLKMTYQTPSKINFVFGLNSEYQDNTIDGRGFIIPEYWQFNLASYAISKYSFSENGIFQCGLRYDFGKVLTKEYFDWFTSPIVENEDTIEQYLQRAIGINRSFSNLTWSVGYNYSSENWIYKINFGKSFRMPIAKELAANGVNYHNFSYEVGNSELSSEISYQLDAGLEFASKRFAIGTTPFLNYFANYIYLNPSAEHDRLYGNGNQIFYYTQSKVFRLGTEVHAHYQLFKVFKLGLVGEYVYSKQRSGEKKGFSLPFSPPATLILNLTYRKQKFKFIENMYFTLDYKITASQNNIVPPEESTDGSQIINLGIGGEFEIGYQKIDLSIQLKNLFNTKYFNHTSFYRLINVPEPGRNFIINISVPFSIKNKPKINNQ